MHSDIHGGQTVLRCLMSAGPGTYNRFSARDDVAAAAAAAVQADPAPDAAGMLPNRGPSFQCEYCNCQPLNDWPALRSHYSKEHKDLHMAAKAARKTQKEQNQQAARHGVKRRHSNPREPAFALRTLDALEATCLRSMKHHITPDVQQAGMNLVVPMVAKMTDTEWTVPYPAVPVGITDYPFAPNTMHAIIGKGSTAG